MMHSIPVNARHPTSLRLRILNDAGDLQVVRTAVWICVVRIEFQNHIRSQYHVLLSKIFRRTNAVQSHSSIRISILEVDIDSWFRHLDGSPFLVPSPPVGYARRELPRLRRQFAQSCSLTRSAANPLNGMRQGICPRHFTLSGDPVPLDRVN